MAKLEFRDISFEDKKDKIRINFLRIFCFDLDKVLLQKISDFKIEKNSITFDVSETKARSKFNFLLENGFKELKNKINNKKTIYIHKNSGIPLIGHVAFGLIDRGTSLIEIKPITSCNLRCIYCSVDEDKRPVDFVIEADYLTDEFRKLVEFKGTDNIEAHIASQGEPLLYAPLIDLIKGIKKIKQVNKISIDTNGVLLNERLVDKLVEAGLTQFNLSINALDKELARKIAGAHYDIERIKNISRHIAKKADLIITPVIVPSINEDEMSKLIEFSKEINAKIGIQNFLNYKFGRNPVKQLSWDAFYEKLRRWEKRYDVKLVLDESYFNIKKTRELKKPFRKGEIVKISIISQGRLSNEKIAVARGRVISIPNCRSDGIVKVNITRTKHNIFIGRLA